MGSRAVTPPNSTETISRLSAGKRIGWRMTNLAPDRSWVFLDSLLPKDSIGLGEVCKNSNVPRATSKTRQTIPAEADTPSQLKKSPPMAGPEIRATCSEEAIQAEARGKFSLSMIRGTIEKTAGWEKARAVPVRKEEKKSAAIWSDP